MSRSTRVIAAFAMLLPIALFSRTDAVGAVSAAAHSGLEEVDEDCVDAYIRAGTCTRPDSLCHAVSRLRARHHPDKPRPVLNRTHRTNADAHANRRPP
jgi:hypothetical protein